VHAPISATFVPIRLAFYCCIRGFFPKIQLYSALRMDEPLQLKNATTTESLLELSSVLDSSLNDWNEELSAGSSKTRVEKHGSSLSADAEPIPGTKDPTKSFKCDAKQQKKGQKTQPFLKKSDIATYSNLLLLAKV